MRKSGVVLGGAVLTMFLAGCSGAGGGAMMSPEAPSATAPAAPGGGAPKAEAAAAGYPAAPAPMASSDATASSMGAPSAAVPAPASAKAAESEAPIASGPVRREPPRLPQAGQLTAGIWDDNRNFDFFKPYMTNFRQANGSDFSMFSDQELTTARDVANRTQGAHADLDVQIVLDTTGSMGDELSYLQGEFDAIAARVKTRFPNVTPRWSLVVYRDKGDDYVTREFDFTTDTNRFRRDLRAQSAGGGGDIPEAVVQGLDAGSRMSWRQQGNVAKIAFWVADAPAHPGEGKQLANVVRGLKSKGIHVYPIAASDTDEAAEYQMRSTAQMTGGRYVFLTNDSGVGNSHAEPHIPCYAVTRLDSAIVRSIESELSGRRIEADANDVLRNVGQPDKEGKCKLSSGALVASF